MKDREFEFQFFLAETLGKTIGEILEMPHLEFVQWSMYYQVKSNRAESERLKAKVKR